jgi:hypothetical protein
MRRRMKGVSWRRGEEREREIMMFWCFGDGDDVFLALFCGFHFKLCGYIYIYI